MHVDKDVVERLVSFGMPNSRNNLFKASVFIGLGAACLRNKLAWG